MDAFSILKSKIHLKHEPGGNFWDISGWTSGKFSCIGQDIDRAGLFRLRKIFWETFHESFSCHSFYTGDRDMTKKLMNKLRESSSFNSIDSWDNNILVNVSIDLEHFDLKIVKIVVSLVWWSTRMTLRVNKFTMFNRFRCNLFKTNIKLEDTWLYSVGRVTWTIISCSNWIYNRTVRKATYNNPNSLGISRVSISQFHSGLG